LSKGCGARRGQLARQGIFAWLETTDAEVRPASRGAVYWRGDEQLKAFAASI